MDALAKTPFASGSLAKVCPSKVLSSGQVLLLGFMLLLVLPGIGYAGTDTVVLQMEPSEPFSAEPGKYIYNFLGGFQLIPICFGIDESKYLYIPELTHQYRIRMHKFSPTGEFLETREMEGECSAIANIAVADDGTTYLYLSTGSGVSYIARYNTSGELEACIGPQGKIGDRPDLPSGAPSQVIEAAGERYFRVSVDMMPLPNNQLLIAQGSSPDAVKQFSNRGEVAMNRVEKDTAPVKSALSRQATKRELISKYLERLNAHGNAVKDTKVGPDGKLYYMVVTRERLEIRRIDDE